MSFIGDLFSQAGVPCNSYARTPRCVSTPKSSTKLPTQSTKPQTRPFPLKRASKKPTVKKPTVKREPASSSGNAKIAKRKPIFPNKNARMQKGKQICRVKREPISRVKREQILGPISQDVPFQMCIPGEVDPVREAASLNVQQPELRCGVAGESVTNFMMVPTQPAQSTQSKQVIVRGRKPKMQVPLCRAVDGKCGQCRRCHSRAYWDKHGAIHAAEVMSVHGDKQMVWAAWKEEGVGCVMCFNYGLYLTKEMLTLKRCSACPWANFKMLIFRKNALSRHEETMGHRKAVSFHATGKLTMPTSVAPSPKEPTPLRVPSLAAVRRLCTGIQHGSSLNAIAAQESATKSGERGRHWCGFISKDSVRTGLAVIAETFRQTWRLSLETCKLAVSSDSAGEVDAVTFRAFDGRKVWHGSFGLAEHHRTQGMVIQKKSDIQEQKASALLADTVVGVIRSFCTERTAANTLCLNENLFKKINESVLFTILDGAPYAQLCGLILCREHFKNALGAEKDTFHDFIKITEEPAKKDPAWGPIRYELLAKKHSIIKDLHYASTVKADWQQWQKEVLSQEGSQSGCGSHQVTSIIQFMPYAPTRAAVEADCFEVWCRTMKATMCTMADRVSKGNPEVQRAYVRALETMSTGVCLRVGLNTDKKIMERKTLRRFDHTTSFQPMKKRIFEEHQVRIWAMVHEGGVVSQSNSGTMTAIVIQAIRDNVRIEYGSGILAMSDESLETALEEEMKSLQRQSRVVNALLDEHNNESYMMNKTQCFDLCRWETISNEGVLEMPWKGRDVRLKHGDHRALLLDNFQYFCKVCNVTNQAAGQLFDVWRRSAFSVWKLKKKKLPAAEQAEANYNGEIMLDSWIEAFQNCKAMNITMEALTPIMECVACLSRNTTPTERSLKAIKRIGKHDGQHKGIACQNDCLIVKSYLAQDKTLLINESCPLYSAFVSNWTAWQGRRWCTNKKKRKDVGKVHKTGNDPRFPKRRLHKMMWKTIDRLCGEHRRGGARDRKAVNGEDVSKLRDKKPDRTDDFSEGQAKYIKHHTEGGHDVKRRKLQEQQRAKGRRFCQPGKEPVPLTKARKALKALPKSQVVRISPISEVLKVFFPKGFCAKHLEGRAEEKNTVACFKNVQDVMEADIIAVDNLSRLNERVQRTVVGDKTVGFLHTDMLVARILGKRVCEPEFFRRVLSRRTKLLSTNMDKTWVWAKGLSVKCKAVCTNPAGKKLLLNVSASFTERHLIQHRLLMHAANVRGSRWTITMKDTNHKSKKDTEVKDISHLQDVDALAGHTAILDKTQSGSKIDTLAKVILKRARATEDAIVSGGG
jgi:hypothetical protein